MVYSGLELNSQAWANNKAICATVYYLYYNEVEIRVLLHSLYSSSL